VQKIIKKILRSTGRLTIFFLLRLPGAKRFFDQLVFIKMQNLITIAHNEQTMYFSGVNHLCRFRAESFASKEPDTLKWVESIPEHSVIWDIGANVGIYSIYAAKQRKCKVFAFEPSVFNLEVLARNIYANQLQDLITIVPFALSDEMGASLFKMTSTNWGGALSTFDKGVDQNGSKLESLFEYRTLGVTMDGAVSQLQIQWPNFIKIDVDGIEHFVLNGGSKVLHQVESVLIEINDDFSEQAARSSECLEKAGLVLYKKCHLISSQYNQWWIRERA